MLYLYRFFIRNYYDNMLRFDVVVAKYTAFDSEFWLQLFSLPITDLWSNKEMGTLYNPWGLNFCCQVIQLGFCCFWVSIWSSAELIMPPFPSWQCWFNIISNSHSSVRMSGLYCYNSLYKLVQLVRFIFTLEIWQTEHLKFSDFLMHWQG